MFAYMPQEASSLSIFLAQVLGSYLFLVFLAILLHHQRHKKTMNEFLTNHALLTLSGGFGILFGLLIVAAHNLWISEWPVLITLIGWVTLLQGVLRMFFPDAFVKLVKEMMLKSGYLVWCWIWFVVGLYLMSVGFGFAPNG
jgi:uncharacterized membrane protein YczE